MYLSNKFQEVTIHYNITKTIFIINWFHGVKTVLYNLVLICNIILDPGI